MNNQNKEFQPIFYKGTTFANYEEAKHVLSFNNCVLMDNLFRNQSTKANSDALRAEYFDNEFVLIATIMMYRKKVLLEMNYTEKYS